MLLLLPLCLLSSLQKGFDPVDLADKFAQMTPEQRERAQAAFAQQMAANPKMGGKVPSFDDAAKLMSSLPRDPASCAACAIVASYLGGSVQQVKQELAPSKEARRAGNLTNGAFAMNLALRGNTTPCVDTHTRTHVHVHRTHSHGGMHPV